MTAESIAGLQHEPLDSFDLDQLREPDDGLLWIYKSAVDGFWHIARDADMALQEATNYPVGEIVEYEERMDDYETGERGELRVLDLQEGSA